MRWTWDDESSSGVGEASQNVWSRAYRRKYERGVVDMPDGQRGVALAVRIRVIGLAREIEVVWLRGGDRVLWESFCGMVHGKFK